MYRRFINVLRCKKGGTFLLVALFLFIITLLLSVTLEASKVYSTGNRVKSSAQAALDSFVYNTAKEIYGSVKQGSDYNSSVSQSQFLEMLTKELNLTKSGNRYSHISDGKTLYYIESPTITFTVTNTVKLKITYTLVIPVRPFGQTFGTFTKELEQSSIYVLKGL